MEQIESVFETYIIVNDEEFKCEVSVSGDFIKDGFETEFGYRKHNYIDNVFVDSITNLEDNSSVSFSTLDKKQKNELLEMAYEYLNDTEEFEEELYYG